MCVRMGWRVLCVQVGVVLLTCIGLVLVDVRSFQSISLQRWLA